MRKKNQLSSEKHYQSPTIEVFEINLENPAKIRELDAWWDSWSNSWSQCP